MISSYDVASNGSVFVFRIGSLARRIERRLQGTISAVLNIFRKGLIDGRDDTAFTMRADTVELLTSRWNVIGLASTASQFAFFVAPLVSRRMLRVSFHDVGFPKTFSAFAKVRLMPAMPITPGGVGITRFGLVGVLAAGPPEGAKPGIAAAVMVYTALTHLAIFPIGIICYFIWRGQRKWRLSL